MIEVENVSKSFRVSRNRRRELGTNFRGSSIDAVRDLNFSCAPGRVCCLLGANGAGKTTMLRMIATILTPSAGGIRVGGHDTRRDPQAVRSRLGFLTGSTGLYERLTPNELVRYFADLNGMDRSHFQQRRDALFGLLGVDEYADRRIGRLSTGMKQKVSIVRTMIHDPDVLVFDEPTAGLDVITARHIIELIRASKEAGKTVLFSTHIMSEVSLLADDLVMIHNGALRWSGQFDTFREQMQSDSLEAEFIRLAETQTNPQPDASFSASAFEAS